MKFEEQAELVKFKKVVCPERIPNIMLPHAQRTDHTMQTIKMV